MKKIYKSGFYTLVVENITFDKLYLTAKQAKETIASGYFAGVAWKSINLNEYN